MVKKTISTLSTWFGFVFATAFFWGVGEALANRFWPPRFVWQPDLLLTSLFNRVVFYAAVVAAAALVVALGRGLVRLIRKRPFDEGRRRWAGPTAAAAVLAFNAGWIVAGASNAVYITIGFNFDLRKVSGFLEYWGLFAAAGAALAGGLAFLLGKRRWAWKVGRVVRAAGAIGFFAVAAAYGGYQWSRPMPRGPNVILIVLDAWRGDCFRPSLMPKLSAYADKNALVFERAWTNATWTHPAMTTLFTGQYPDTCQTRKGARADELSPTLAQALRDDGYDTSAFVANRLLDRHDAVCDGFEEFYFTDNHPLLAAIRFYGTNWYGPAVRDAVHKDALSEDSRKLVRALSRYRAREHRRPFFAWVHFMDPHAPYTPPPGYYYPQDEPFVVDFDQFDRARRGPNRRLYEGECRFMDDILTPILPALAADRRTIVIITGDHGEEFWEHNKYTYGHGKSVYETLMRVPLIMTLPGKGAGRTDVPVSLVDLAPSLLALTGQAPLPTMQGTPFINPGGGIARGNAPIFLGSQFFKMEGGKPERQDAIILWPRKLILYHARPGDPGEYYDLLTDPYELRPIPEDAFAADMRARLTTWILRTNPNYEGTLYGGANPTDLKALGYIK